MKSKSDAKNDLERLKCKRTYSIKLNKNRLWWQNKFNELEKKSRIPDYKKLKCLREVFTNKEIEEITSAGAEIIKDPKTSEVKSDYIQIKKTDNVSFRKSRWVPLPKAQYTNPYIEFMNKSKDEANCWREKPPRNFNDEPIIERAEALKKEVIRKFVQVFDSKKSGEINEHTLSSIYEMVCPFPICSALNTSTQIFDAMPEVTTRYLGCIEKSDHNKLKSEILKDIKASEKPPLYTAFGKNLPVELRRQPFKENPGIKWSKLNAEHDHLETFADVWKNITDLESTRKFCLYLLDHPEVKPPPFLLKQGMLMKNILKKPVYLGNLEKQFENRDSIDMLDVNNLLRNANKALVDFNRRFTELTRRTSASLSIGEISDVNIMV